MRFVFHYGNEDSVLILFSVQIGIRITSELQLAFTLTYKEITGPFILLRP